MYIQKWLSNSECSEYVMLLWRQYIAISQNNVGLSHKLQKYIHVHAYKGHTSTYVKHAYQRDNIYVKFNLTVCMCLYCPNIISIMSQFVPRL